MKINWKIRLKNKNFWLALVPALMILFQVILALFGYEVDIANVNDKLVSVINAFFAVLSIIGIVNDPTTQGLSDSNRALSYDKLH